MCVSMQLIIRVATLLLTILLASQVCATTCFIPALLHHLHSIFRRHPSSFLQESFD